MATTFQDDLLEVSASRLRASGAITADATSVVVTFGQGLSRPPALAGVSAKRGIPRHDARCSHEVARCAIVI